MVSHHHQSYTFISLRYFLVFLCISMVIIQVSQALDAELLSSSSSVEDSNDHQLDRRNSKKVAQMLEQILRRGEMQVEPYRIQKFLGRLNRRKTNDQMKSSIIHHF
ncbi:hypothetical protein I4U23_027991 [Adineta vaga]|nr:hypothetical protein I4U23_027991 [Adineta vaga]